MSTKPKWIPRSFDLTTCKTAPAGLPTTPEEAVESLREAVAEGECGYEEDFYSCCPGAHHECPGVEEQHVRKITHYLHQEDVPRPARSPVQVEQEWDSHEEWRWAMRCECPCCDEVTTWRFRPGCCAEWAVVEE